MSSASALFALLVVSTSTTATSTSTSTSALTTSVRAEAEESVDLLLPLKLPEALTELALLPLLPVVLAFERLRIHERVFDLLTNDAKTMAVVPIIDVLSRSGFSAGAAFVLNDPLGSPDRLIALAIYRRNTDRLASFSFTRRLPFLSGKRVHFGAGYSLDHDERYYGLGSTTEKSSERLLQTESIDLDAWLELPAPAVWNLRLGFAYRRLDLSGGTGDAPGLKLGDTVIPPAGFGRALDYPEVMVSLSYDSRDSESRTTRGFVAQLSGLLTHDLNDGETGGLQATAQLGLYIPVLPLYRTLVLAAGASIAEPFGRDNEIPYHALVDLGGDVRLRGYESRRFVDRVGFWGTAEYRYKVYEWAGSGTGLSATIFGDAGRVARTPGDLLDVPLRWSVGFGLRAEMDLFFLARFQIAYSPDGFRFILAVNDIL